MTGTKFEFEVTFRLPMPCGEAFEETRVMGGYATERKASSAMNRMIRVWTGDDQDLTLISAEVRPER